MDSKIEDLKELIKRRKKYLKSLLKEDRYGYDIESEVKQGLEEIKRIEDSLNKK